jgi:hypothetical protein
MLGGVGFNKSNCPQPGNPDNPQPLGPAKKFAGLLFLSFVIPIRISKTKLDKMLYSCLLFRRPLPRFKTPI